MPGWVASNVVGNVDLLCRSHKAVMARMDLALQTTSDGFSAAFDATKAAILKQLDLVLAGIPATLVGDPAEVHQRFESVLTNYKSSEPETRAAIMEASLEESEMTFQTEFLSTVFQPLMRLTVRDTNIVEGPVRPDFVGSAVLKLVQRLVRMHGELPEIGGQKMVGTYVVAEFAGPGRDEAEHIEDAEKLREEVCRKEM
jgi:hypothetical protein